jgi:tetratricopeptide (TPR) repeat protein
MTSRLLALFLLLTVAPVWAQFPTTQSPQNHVGTVRVEVDYSNGSHAPAHLRVQLRQGINNTPVAVDLTNTSGTAEFTELDPGEYSIRVTGDGIEPAESETFPVEDGKNFQTVMVTIKNRAGAEPGAEVRSSAASVAAMDLNVPKKAAKEFERSSQEMSQENWGKAIEHLDKAIAIYPQYSSAYNDLAVCYGRLKQEDKQREALLKAISANDHCIPALVNLAHMDMKGNQLADAVSLLNRATAADPSNVEALGLLAQVDFLQGHYEQAIADAHKVHSLPHEHFALVHYTAASAYERENRIADAVAELKIFLQEEPQGPRADAVRKVLVAVQNEAQNQDQNQVQSQSH